MGVLWVLLSCQRGPLSFDDFWKGYATATCATAVDCNVAEVSFLEPCVEYLTRAQRVSDMKRRIAMGAATYDPAAATECLADYRAFSAAPAGCTRTEPFQLAACGRVLTPRSISTGARCSVTYPTCEGENDVCAGTHCNETCQPSGGLGQPCTSWYCNPGYYCDETTRTCATRSSEGSPCTIPGACDSLSYCDVPRGLCVRLPVDGEGCGPTIPRCAARAYCPDLWGSGNCRAYAPLGGACGSTQCAPTAYCDASSTCVARKVSGASCAVAAECEDQLVCLGGRCATPSSEGGPCATRLDCGRDLTCDLVLRTCQSSRSLREEGAACTDSALRCGYDYESEPTFRCEGVATNPDGGVGTMGACRWPHLGDACTERSACAATLTCRIDPIDGGSTCGDLGNSGSPCRAWDQCKEPNICLAGACTPAKMLGAPCDWVGICYSGTCQGRNPDAGILGTCEPYLAAGAPCSQDGECDSQSCVKGVCLAACR